MKKLYSVIIGILIFIAFMGYTQVIKHQQIKEQNSVINTAKVAIKSQKEFKGKNIKIKVLNVTKYKNSWSISYKYAQTGKDIKSNIWLPLGKGSLSVKVKKEINGKLEAYFTHYGPLQKS